MNTQILISAAFIMLLLAFYNGEFIKWDRTTGDEKSHWSAKWHRTGFMIRALVVLIVYRASTAGWALGAVFLAYPVYNAIINRYLGQKWHYIGKKAWLDRNIPHWAHYTAYALLLIASVALAAMGF